MSPFFYETGHAGVPSRPDTRDGMSQGILIGMLTGRPVPTYGIVPHPSILWDVLSGPEFLALMLVV